MGSETPVLVLCNAASPPDESSGRPRVPSCWTIGIETVV